MKFELSAVLALTVAATLFSCRKSTDYKSSQNTSTIADSTTEIVESTVHGQYSLENTYTHTITSSINNKEYEIYVKLPPNYFTDMQQLFPVLVLTDADYAFPLVSSISDRLFHTDLIEQFIIVGVSFSIGDDRGLSKTRDYTPTFSPNEEQGFSKAAKMSSGYADKFAKFLSHDVINFVADHYRIKANHKALAGHSFGGLFTSYVSIAHSDFFEYYLIGSPSLWYHDKAMFRIERKYAQTHDNLNSNIFLAIGSLEDSKNYHPMVTQMESFKAQISARNYPDLEIKSVVIPDEDHYTVYPSFITKGIIWAFEKGKY